MKTKYLIAVIVILMMSVSAYAHCEVPCGIYGDKARVDLIREHVTTIEKSMDMIEKLSAEESINYNQLVRWINNKEEHAIKIQDIVTQYFMFQRVKPVNEGNKKAQKKYSAELEALHRIAVSAMKAKQGTDKSHTQRILTNLHEFEHLYFEEHEH